MYELDIDNMTDFATVVERWDDHNYGFQFVAIRDRHVTGAMMHLVLGGPGRENLPNLD